MKTMLITFFDINGTFQFQFIPQGQRVDQAYYVEILKWYVKLRVEKHLNFGPTTGFSAMTMLHFIRCCQAVSGPKIHYQNVTPTLLP
jgi:hypothetical protein